MYPLIKFLLFYVLTCLGQNVFGSEIINGHEADDNTMQYMAFLKGELVCGGFLISEDFVMTAAHCAGMKTVILGTHDLKKTDKHMMYGVKKECKHPDYEYPATNDIMLVRLSRKAELGENIKPIKIPTRSKHLKPEQMCTVAGWGLTKTDGNTADELQVADVPVIDLGECDWMWGGLLPPKTICAGGYHTNKGFCDGDSGGPLVCDGVAVGVVSFGEKKCNYPSWPNVYTDISKFLPWINDILKKKTC